jgi:hypothetical protein
MSKAKCEPDRVLAIFIKFDTNGNGFIERSELISALFALDAYFWTEVKVDAMLKAADSNKDGMLDYEELLTWIFKDGDLQDAVKVIAPEDLKKLQVAATVNGAPTERIDETPSAKKPLAETVGVPPPPMTLALLQSLWPQWNSDPANASGTDTYHPIHSAWRDAACSAPPLEEPLLFLGGNAITEGALTTCGVTHILSLVSLKRCQKPAAAEAGQFERLVIDIEDDFNADIQASFDVAFKFIDSARRGGGICYVHCEQGRSRSASMVIAWLMHHRARSGKHPSLLECYSAIASRRRISALNYGFFARLCDLEGKLALQTYGSYAGTPSLALLQYFILTQHDPKLFAYPPAPSLEELRNENGLELHDVSATVRQKAMRRLLRGFCFVLEEVQGGEGG